MPDRDYPFFILVLPLNISMQNNILSKWYSSIRHLSLFDQKQNGKINYLVSYPRSGNSLLRYFIELITMKTTHDSGKEKGIHTFVKTIKVIDKTPLLQKQHSWSKVCVNDVNKMIVLIRNYRNCLISHATRQTKKQPIVRNDQINSYVNILKGYDSLNKDKIIIYYEDFISNTTDVLKKTFNFLGENVSFENVDIDFHKKHFLSVYKKITGSITQGDLSKSLENEISQENLNKIELEIRKDKNIFDKYLSRYNLR